MRVLITGGTGFIGSRLALRCLERGDEVAILSQLNTPAEKQNSDELTSRGIDILVGGVGDKEVVSAAVANCDTVFHLAAAQHEVNVPDSHFRAVNVEGTRNLLDASVKANIRRFIHGSTIGVYGVDQQGELNEESPLRPDNIYGITKQEGEALVLSYRDQLPVSVIRISETYGPGDRRLLKLFKGIQNRTFFVIGNGENKHQLIYVDDLIDGLFAAECSDEAPGEVFIIAGNDILSTNEMVDTIANTLGVEKVRVRAPMWPFYILAVILEKLLIPVGIQPPLHRRRLDFFKKTLYFSSEKSQNKMKYKAKTSFQEGARRTAEWYRSKSFL